MINPTPTVLLTNDDGPPDPRESPYVLGLYRQLTEVLGWNVKVVLPSAQKSWIGEATAGKYFYPKEDGKGELSPKSRPLQPGELTPATCANVALHNLYPGQIDLVISGPNLGRNTSAAFALSSGTIGAALSSSLSKVRSIALSYGTVVHPTPKTYFQPAHVLGARILQHLWQNWGSDELGLKAGEVDLYNVNIPLIEGLLSQEDLKIYWTNIWRNSYGRLFKNVASDSKSPDKLVINPAGPDSSVDPQTQPRQRLDPVAPPEGDLLFKWAPDMGNLIQPSPNDLPVGSDGWAIHNGWVSVTPLRASFAEAPLLAYDPILRNLKL
ncbi:cytoplasm protein [Coprinopsis marcescibilis]|uniref:Cytoplasm protein n=1 Tax=Coprinopsis marcescibilis TaxID=230819 RepID=A0A5C3LBL8_COPMA|nr:cytoplasm protein [Coprinopsis marcescibilis]